MTIDEAKRVRIVDFLAQLGHRESSAAVHLRVWKTNRRGQEGTGEGIRWKR